MNLYISHLGELEESEIIVAPSFNREFNSYCLSCSLLSDLIKSKPNISDETLAAAIEAFRSLQTDCCAAENKKECFDTKVYLKQKNGWGKFKKVFFLIAASKFKFLYIK